MDTHSTDSRSKELLQTIISHWVRQRKITRHKLANGTIYISYSYQKHNIPAQYKYHFFIADLDEQHHNSKSTVFSLIDPDLLSVARTDMNTTLQEQDLNVHDDVFEEELWRCIHDQSELFEHTYDFNNSSSIKVGRLNTDVLFTEACCLSFRTNNDLVVLNSYYNGFYSFLNQRENSNSHIEKINILQRFAGDTSTYDPNGGELTDIHQHFAQHQVGGFTTILDPLYSLLEQLGTEKSHHYLIITWIINCYLLDHQQLALQIIGCSADRNQFCQKLSNVMNGVDYVNCYESVGEDNIIEQAFNSHLVELGRQNELSISTQQKIVQLLNGSHFDLTYFNFQSAPQVFMKRPVIWTCYEPLPLSPELSERTLTIKIRSAESGRYLPYDELIPALIASIFRLVVHAKIIDFSRAQKTSHYIPEPLKDYDQLGNELSKKFFGNKITPYTDFGIQMDQYLPELIIASHSPNEWM